jgi:hypothetical protein
VSNAADSHLYIIEQRFFAAKQMRASGNVENDSTKAIIGNQGRIAIAPVDETLFDVSRIARQIG